MSYTVISSFVEIIIVFKHKKRKQRYKNNKFNN
jgi:hypothetical protein